MASLDAQRMQEDSGGVRNFFLSKIEELTAKVREKTKDLRRLQAQRNELNSRGKEDGED